MGNIADHIGGIAHDDVITRMSVDGRWNGPRKRSQVIVELASEIAHARVCCRAHRVLRDFVCRRGRFRAASVGTARNVYG